MAYTINRPTANEKLKTSQPLIRDNFTSSNTSFGIDHYPFNDGTANDGRHRIIKQTNVNLNSTVRIRDGQGNSPTNFPTNITDVNQVFSAQYVPDYSGAVADTQLFTVTGSGGISQLTGNFATEEGWQWIGGVLMQWGFVSKTSSAANQTTKFKDRGSPAQGIPFPNACFNVQATIVYNGAPTSSKRNSILIEKNTGPSPSREQFKWTIEIEDATVLGFFWTAIGN